MSRIPELQQIQGLRDALYRHNSGLLRERESLRERTTYRIGGVAELFYSPFEISDVMAAVTFANEWKVQYRILGGGSNLLIADEGVTGLVIDLQDYLNRIHYSGDELAVQAGAKLIHAARFAAFHELAGLESLAGIPGSVGGGIHMNCGAFDSEISDHLSTLQTVESNGSLRDWHHSEIAWGYRSAPQLRNSIIVSATFQFPRQDRAVLFTRIREVLKLRRDRQPLQQPSAGSVFKRPAGQFAGKLIEAAGLKGYRIGDAEISSKHAGFIVNLGHATASDIRKLMQHAQEVVHEHSGIQLELEQVLWGFPNATI